jgi:hypothetical protein
MKCVALVNRVPVKALQDEGGWGVTVLGKVDKIGEFLAISCIGFTQYVE